MVAVDRVRVCVDEVRARPFAVLDRDLAGPDRLAVLFVVAFRLAGALRAVLLRAALCVAGAFFLTGVLPPVLLVAAVRLAGARFVAGADFLAAGLFSTVGLFLAVAVREVAAFLADRRMVEVMIGLPRM